MLFEKVVLAKTNYYIQVKTYLHTLVKTIRWKPAQTAVLMCSLVKVYVINGGAEVN